MSAYFTRGTGHDEYARYTEDAEVYLRIMERLKRKYDTAKQYVPKPVLHENKNAAVGIIAFGSTENAIFEAQHQLANGHGIESELMRVRAVPFTEEVSEFVEKYEQVFVVEMNRDGQLCQILKMEYPQFGRRFKSVAYQDGLPASAKWVREGILEKYEAAGGDQSPVISDQSLAIAVQRKVSAGRMAAKTGAGSRSRKEAAAKPGRKSAVKSKRK
jgi:2-oxoglutarate ferredoxin oxidoreductase subunit alpha